MLTVVGVSSSGPGTVAETTGPSTGRRSTSIAGTILSGKILESMKNIRRCFGKESAIT